MRCLSGSYLPRYNQRNAHANHLRPATKATAPKTRKPETNNYVGILEQFLEKCNLSASSTSEQLSEHAPELDALLPDWMARRYVKVALAKPKHSFRKAEYCAKAGDFVDIIANHWAVGPKNKDEKEIVASVSRQSTFRVKLAEGGIDSAIIKAFAKDKELIQDSNKIQKKRIKKRMANPDRIPIHFFLANVQKRIQNMDVSKIPTREDLADVIVMLSMRPSEFRTWYKEGYSWYCTGYKKADGRILHPLLSMEKNPERARELLT
ncbi:unnamed protein product [Rhizophagus irregularis]|nr:unnamed protein product [Rhizophagus irregularis]